MSRLVRATLLGATVASGATALLGLSWLAGLRPTAYAVPGAALLAQLAGADAATVVHVLAGLTGVAAGIAALAGALGTRGRTVTAALQVAVLGFVLQGTGPLSTVGYLVAMAMPAAVVVLLVQVVRRYRVARWTVGVPGLALLLGGGFLLRDAVAGVVRMLGAGLAEHGAGLILSLLLLVTGALWAAVGAQALSGTAAAERATAWVLRHRTAITIVAATGPLPYALVRLTWLTPWPQLGFDIDLSARVWGLTLSSGAWLGVVLTLGLIRPWGEVFPRWMPGLAGRRVPVAAAAVPGGLVAATLIFSTVPMLVMFSDQTLGQAVLGAIVFPCWYWGPALALAVWGYVAHRTPVDRARENRAEPAEQAARVPGLASPVADRRG
ncbi:hypothetical protein ACFQBY_06785 [Promicromonospora citrea]|uniref:Uncharacterized protein n=1 Tax=Promicromonospora citrea TaxID=43677 RepID=A0A8H9GDP1_9MICO|nr:hypothetical protein [Promicromonospora citrea]NNH54640.1 hypothetical protein [Promicromonospora citrea]GGM12587.1 hypothetical protein GCM10010102_05350 [Promicromonospora citrea]